MASAVIDGSHGDLEAALAQYERQRDQCAIPLSDANLGIARLGMPAGALGAAWFQMNGLEQALDDPAAAGDCGQAVSGYFTQGIMSAPAGHILIAADRITTRLQEIRRVPGPRQLVLRQHRRC